MSPPGMPAFKTSRRGPYYRIKTETSLIYKSKHPAGDLVTDVPVPASAKVDLEHQAVFSGTVNTGAMDRTIVIEHHATFTTTRRAFTNIR